MEGGGCHTFGPPTVTLFERRGQIEETASAEGQKGLILLTNDHTAPKGVWKAGGVTLLNR